MTEQSTTNVSSTELLRMISDVVAAYVGNNTVATKDLRLMGRAFWAAARTRLGRWPKTLLFMGFGADWPQEAGGVRGATPKLGQPPVHGRTEGNTDRAVFS